jgi:voltage-gated potassium channel
MVDKLAERILSPRSVLTYASHFLRSCHILRGVLGAHFLVVVLGGVTFSLCERIRITEGIYFALITATTVGYGDITPKTGIGQCISVLLALVGTVFFGLVVAVATRAFTVTVREYLPAHQDPTSDS